ncbi:5449_t:CDS:2, partial [Racocetra persica]
IPGFDLDKYKSRISQKSCELFDESDYNSYEKTTENINKCREAKPCYGNDITEIIGDRGHEIGVEKDKSMGE